MIIIYKKDDVYGNLVAKRKRFTSFSFDWYSNAQVLLACGPLKKELDSHIRKCQDSKFQL